MGAPEVETREGSPGPDRRRTAVATVLIAGLAALGVYAAIANAPETSASSDSYSPFALEPVTGAQVSRVTLDEAAVERLGIVTAPVRAATVKNRPGLVIPYSAVVYDQNGQAWTFTNPAPRTFLRHRLSVDHVEGVAALLASGPPVGTAVVSVGAAELLGAEIDFGKG